MNRERRSRCAGSWLSRWRLDFREAAHVRPENFGDGDGAVGLLVVLEDGGPGPTDGDAGAIQGVDEFCLRPRVSAVANGGPPCLKILEVTAGRDLPVELLAWKPHLEIVGLCGGKAQVARAKDHRSVGKMKPLQDLFGIRGELFQGLV